MNSPNNTDFFICALTLTVLEMYYLSICNIFYGNLKKKEKDIMHIMLYIIYIIHI